MLLYSEKFEDLLMKLLKSCSLLFCTIASLEEAFFSCCSNFHSLTFDARFIAQAYLFYWTVVEEIISVILVAYNETSSCHVCFD